jgi:hypothetical protein
VLEQKQEKGFGHDPKAMKVMSVRSNILPKNKK